MMRLGRLMGRHEAHQLLYEAAQRAQSEQVPLMTAIGEHPLLAGHGLPSDLSEALEPTAYVGESVAITVETVARTRVSATRDGPDPSSAAPTSRPLPDE